MRGRWIRKRKRLWLIVLGIVVLAVWGGVATVRYVWLFTPLHHAAMDGDALRVRILATRNPKMLEARDATGGTPLHQAAWCSASASEALLSAGANIEARRLGSQRVTPVFLASAGCDPDAVAVFIQRGAKLNARDAYGATPLHYAARYRNGLAVQQLIDAGADVNARDHADRTPLDEAKPGKGGPTPDQQAVYRMIKQAGGE